MITGGCLCGAVRYESSGEPVLGVHCHCRNCQKATGTGHLSAMAIPKDTFRMTGEVKSFAVDMEPGKRSFRHFCPNCGSHLFGKPEMWPDLVTLYVGTLDNPGIFQPQYIMFAQSRQHWDMIDPALPAHKTVPT